MGKTFWPLAIVASLMLVMAIPPGWPYAYYQLLRWVISGIAAWFALNAFKSQHTTWTWIFGAIAVVFNPIAPFYLGRDLWKLVDAVCAVAFPVGMIAMNKRVK